MRKVHIGCSGFTYRDWRGTFYPSNLDNSSYLSYYEKFFSVLEVNYTFYSMPHRYTSESFINKTKKLRFSIKANRVFTHDRSFSEKELERFLEGIKPITESDRFIALLFQFPQSFHYSEEALEYLESLALAFSGYNRVIEFRHRSFSKKELFSFIENLGFSLVNTDAPKLKGVMVGPWESVGTINYIRLHGRNFQKWHGGEESYERYDYLYSEQELRELKEKIERIHLGKETFIFFNNHYRGKGVLNALKMKSLFGEEVKVPKGLKPLEIKRLWE